MRWEEEFHIITLPDDKSTLTTSVHKIDTRFREPSDGVSGKASNIPLMNEFPPFFRPRVREGEMM